MKPAEFADWTRKDGPPLRGDEVKVQVGETVYNARGTISVERDQFCLHLTLLDNQALPLGQGVFGYDDFWRISGVIADTLPFSTKGVADRNTSHSGIRTVFQTEIHVQHLSFSTPESAAHEGEIEELKEAIRQQSSSDPKPMEKRQSYYAFARLPGHELIWANTSTSQTRTNDFLGVSDSFDTDTFQGRFGPFEYALVKEGGDCDVHFRKAKDVEQLVAEAEFREHFEALLNAIAFLHGCDAWPQHRLVKINGITVQEDVSAQSRLRTSHYKPLNKRACYSGADMERAFRCATEFFHAGTRASVSLERFLHLQRQASDNNTPLDLGILALCTVLEGVIDTLYSAYIPPSGEQDIDGFSEARAELIRYAKEQDTAGKPGFKRLQGLLQSAKPLNMREKFQRLSAHFSLPWANVMEDAFLTWNKERHVLAHGSAHSEDKLERILHPSRLAGAINLLALKSMGYSGIAVFSALEGRLLNI